MKYIALFMLGFLFCSISTYAQSLLRTSDARISLVSSAPLEIIKASSNNCQGVLNPATGEFAFRVYVKSFTGFNSPLQREHFYENYMEVSEYPEAVFRGKVVEEIAFETQGPLLVRAKGALTVHGISQERIIDIELNLTGEDIHFGTEFMVFLKDHNIGIPNIVRQKIAERINVSVKGVLHKRS